MRNPAIKALESALRAREKGAAKANSLRVARAQAIEEYDRLIKQADNAVLPLNRAVEEATKAVVSPTREPEKQVQLLPRFTETPRCEASRNGTGH